MLRVVVSLDGWMDGWGCILCLQELLSLFYGRLALHLHLRLHRAQVLQLAKFLLPTLLQKYLTHLIISGYVGMLRQDPVLAG